MKEIRAYIQPFVLGRLVQELMDIPGFPGMTVVDCEGFGLTQVEAKQSFNPFLPKKRVEIIANDEQVEDIVAVVMQHAHTGRAGDGKVVVFDAQTMGHIRTGERSERLI